MSVDHVSPHAGHVAVAGSRNAAAAAFGRDHDDLLVTSYADFATEVDLGEVSSLDLVADAAMAPVLAAAAGAVHRGQHLELRLATDGDADPVTVATIIERCSLHVLDVADARGRPVLLLGSGPSAPSAGELALRALSHSPAAPSPQEAPPASQRSTEEPAPAPVDDLRTGSRPEPQLVGWLRRAQGWRGGGRVRLLAAATVVVGVVVLLVLGAISSAALLTIAVPLLAGLALAGTVSTCYLVLVLSRQLNAQTRRLERIALGNREVVRRRSRALETRVAALEAQVAAPHVMDYLEAVAAHGAETAASVRDLAASVERGQRD